jgi:hypothetical protein
LRVVELSSAPSSFASRLGHEFVSCWDLSLMIFATLVWGLSLRRQINLGCAGMHVLANSPATVL